MALGGPNPWLLLDPSPPHLGRLRAINPECGFFGVAPGTSWTTNPHAMATIQRNTIFTNVGQTSDGGVYWEGMDQPLEPGITFTSWLGQPWSPGRTFAPPSFCWPYPPFPPPNHLSFFWPSPR